MCIQAAGHVRVTGGHQAGGGGVQAAVGGNGLEAAGSVSVAGCD